VIGLAITLWFVAHACQRLDRQLLLVVGALVVTWMLQPVALATFPIVMVTLGVGTARRPEPDREMPPRIQMAHQAAMLVGILLAGWLMMGDLLIKDAVDASDLRALERSAAAFPADPVVADLVAQAFLLEQVIDPRLDDKVLEWSQRAVDREPDRPYYWRQHASRLFALGRDDEALAAVETALRLQPWHLQSWQLLYAIGDGTENDELMRRAAPQLCELGVAKPEC